MIVTIEDIKTTLETDSFDKTELLTNITDTIGDMKLKYVSKDKELLKVKADFKKLGYDNNEFADRDTFINHITELKSKVQTDSEAKVKLQLAENKLNEYMTKESNWLRAADNAKIEKVLTDELGTKLKGSRYIINDLINTGKVKLVDNDVVFLEGDTPTILKTGIDKILKDNADLVIADQNPGANTKNKPNTNNVSNITLESIKKMTPEQIKANLADIKKLAGSRPGIR